MADETTPNDEQAPEEQPEAAAPAEETPAPEAEIPAPAEEAPAEEVVAEATVVSSDEATVGEEVVVEAAVNPAEPEEAVEAEAPAAEAEEKPREKPAIPGADLEVDIVLEGQEALDEERDPYALDEEPAIEGEDGDEAVADEPIVAAIELAADARYRATGKRKTAVARVILKPGTGEYLINGKPLNDFFPRPALQRNIRQPLEAVGYEERMDVIARMHGGGVSSQAGALRHGISRALLEADPNLRGALKSRGFLTRDARAKERKKAGLKKARKRPQFSKR